MAATSDYNLVKIGIEAFSLLEEHQQPLKHVKPRQAAQPNPNHNYNYNNGREVIDCNQAAKKYGGLLIVEHRAKNKPPLQPAMFKFY